MPCSLQLATCGLVLFLLWLAAQRRYAGQAATAMLLRDALPRFHAEATTAIAAKHDAEIPEGVSRSALLAQFDTLTLIGADADRCGSFRVNGPGRLADQGYAFSFDFDIPSGNVIADLDRSLQITGFEPISVAAMHDLQSQLDSIGLP